MVRTAGSLFAGILRRVACLELTPNPTNSSPQQPPNHPPSNHQTTPSTTVQVRKNDEHQTITTPATTVVTPEEPFRHFLPAVLFLVTFVMVITTLLIYMDNTAMRQQQFRQNMRHDEVLAKVSQDDDVLVAYIRQWQLSSAAKPFPPHSRHHPLPPEPLPLIPTPTESVVSELLKHKRNGVFVEIGAYSAASGGGSRTRWLEGFLGWRGLLLTPDAHDYFRLRARRTAPGTLTIHACLSWNTHPKEITYQEMWPREEVGVMALGNGEEFSARVKCFPLYSLLLAAQQRNVDFLSLSCGGCEIDALYSLPKDNKVTIAIVEIFGKENLAAEIFLSQIGYNIVTKTSTSTIYAMRNLTSSQV